MGKLHRLSRPGNHSRNEQITWINELLLTPACLTFAFSGHKTCTGCHRPLGLHTEFESSCLQLLIMKQTPRVKPRVSPTFLPRVICILPVTCTGGCPQLREQRKIDNSQSKRERIRRSLSLALGWSPHSLVTFFFVLLIQAGTFDLSNHIRSSEK